MTLTPHQRRLLRAIDSKDFSNVADALLRGAVLFPRALRFTLLANGDVLIEYADASRAGPLFHLGAKFLYKHGRQVVAARLNENAPHPTAPQQFRFRHAPELASPLLNGAPSHGLVS